MGEKALAIRELVKTTKLPDATIAEKVKCSLSYVRVIRARMNAFRKARRGKNKSRLRTVINRSAVQTKWVANNLETEWKLVSENGKDVYATLKCLMVADEDDIWRADNGQVYKSLEEAKKRCASLSKTVLAKSTEMCK